MLISPCGALCFWDFSPSSELPTPSLGPSKSSPLIKSCPGVTSLLPAPVLSSQLPAPKHDRLETALVPVPRIPRSPLCPTTALHFLLNSVSAPASHPLFTYTTASHQHDCITATSLNNSIKHFASLVSLNPQDFFGHSMRRGGATFVFQCGIPSKLIKVQGDWRSDAYMLYLTLPLADRLVLSHAVSQHIQLL